MVGDDHPPQHALWTLGGVAHLAFKIEAEALIAGHLQRRDAQPPALERNLKVDITIAALGRDHLPGAETDEGIPLWTAPPGLGRAGGVLELTARLAHERSVQDHVEHLAQARSRRNESARVELRALDLEPQFRTALPAVLRVAEDRTPCQVADDVARGGTPT